MINVTKTYLPDFAKYTETLKRAWDKSWITNNGELVQELEARLKKYLGVKHLFYCSNGTVVLQMALKTFGITGEVITTPFSYVATTNVILWEGCTPVFADIEPHTFCIDPEKIENVITEKTQAILATHVYGNPCNIERIQEIAEKNSLKVIYDAAHAFGCGYKGRSLLSYGDISTCSFHATKIFHTVEGGCVITNDDEIANRLMLYRQFGHVNDDYYCIGINGKNSEFHAAMGLCVLDDLEQIIENRKELVLLYNQNLRSDFIEKPTELLNSISEYSCNYSYYPILFSSEELLLTTLNRLLENAIRVRRYFYPSLNTLFYANGSPCPVSEDISKRILCLPLFYDLDKSIVEKVSGIINSVNNDSNRS